MLDRDCGCRCWNRMNQRVAVLLDHHRTGDRKKHGVMNQGNNQWGVDAVLFHAVAWHKDPVLEKIPTAKKRAKIAKNRRTDAQKCIRTDAQPRGSAWIQCPAWQRVMAERGNAQPWRVYCRLLHIKLPNNAQVNAWEVHFSFCNWPLDNDYSRHSQKELFALKWQ